ncbi:MAG: pyridoxal-dependent decarboxylase [Chloroflexota bacterium]
MAETEGVEPWQTGSGDMSGSEFRHHAQRVVDWIADYLDHPDRYPVLSRLRPGDISAALPDCAPDSPEPMADILRDFDDLIMPGITHWNHPAFFAYFAITASTPGILGEMLSAALNVNGMLWKTSPAASELEATTLDWLRRLLGLPSGYEGVIYDTASTSSLVAIAAAREACGLSIRDRGMAGRSDLPALRLYCSTQAHSSIDKAAITLGIGQNNLRKIETDDIFRMDTECLARAIQEDLRAGHRPFCVVGVAGTTSTTSVDPLADIAAICADHGLWFHVDAAYGGIAAIVPEMRWILEGADRADSLVVNPHKWLFTPIDLSVLYSRHLDIVRNAFSLVPEYLRTSEDDQVRNYMDYGPQLGRRFRALKLWFVLRAFGRDGIILRLREHIRLAQDFATWIEDADQWELMAPAPMSTVCFRARPDGWDEARIDRLNQWILDTLNEGGEAFLSHTRLDAKLTLRLAIGNLRTSEAHVGRVRDLLQHLLREFQGRDGSTPVC